jgi:hypothetical protein
MSLEVTDFLKRVPVVGKAVVAFALVSKSVTAWDRYQCNKQRIPEGSDRKSALDNVVKLPAGAKYGIDYGYYEPEDFDGAMRCGLVHKPSTITIISSSGSLTSPRGDGQFYLLVTSSSWPPISSNATQVGKVTRHADGSLDAAEFAKFVATFRRVWNERAHKLRMMTDRMVPGDYPR